MLNLYIILFVDSFTEIHVRHGTWTHWCTGLLLITVALPVVVLGEVSEVCKKPKDTGKCEDYNPADESSRYFFNHSSGGCERFQYSGCQGNGNNFRSFLECSQACTCFMPSDKGHCNKSESRFFFNSDEGQCERFDYSGCGGNKNVFRTKDLCHSSCVCSNPVDPGQCKEGENKASSRKFFFDYNANQCSNFTYTECGGNANRFDSERACQGACVCNMEQDPGLCLAFFPSFFYNFTSKACEPFVYGGCMGNGNRFYEKEKCEKSCVEK